MFGAITWGAVQFALIASALPSITPHPAEVNMGARGEFIVTPATPVVVADDITETERELYASVFEEAGLRLRFVRASQHRAGAEGIYVGETHRHDNLSSIRVRRDYDELEPPGPEGYRLSVSRRMIIVAGSDPAGTYYGLQTLCALLETGQRAPVLTIRDEPAAAVRGAYLREKPDASVLDALAAARCNMMVVEHPEFVSADRGRLAEWRGVFEAARERHMTPVPVLPLIDGVEAKPDVGNGIRTVSAPLHIGQWTVFGRDASASATTEDIEVTFSGVTGEPGWDYELTDREDGRGWRIRNLAGGMAPDGAEASIRYPLEAGAGGECLSDPDTRGSWDDAIAAIMETLEPDAVHLGMFDLMCSPSCAGCADAGGSRAERVSRALHHLADSVRAHNEEAALVLSADLLDPAHLARRYGLAERRPRLPENMGLVVGGPIDRARERADWARERAAFVWALGGEDPINGHTWASAAMASGGEQAGVLAHYNDDAVFEAAMNKAWSPAEPTRPWPEGLNAFFGAALWEPDYDAMRDAIAAFVNRQTLEGRPIRERRRQAADFFRSFRRQPGVADSALVDQAATIHEHMLDYLEIEQRFEENRERGVGNRMINLVETHYAFHPYGDEERANRIIGTVQRTGLVVPSTILFGVHLLPMREVRVPEQYGLLEMPINPAFRDSEDRAEARVDLLMAPGPLLRLDFETVGTAELTVEAGGAPDRLSVAAQVESQERGGVQGPVLLRSMPKERHLRITAHAPAETAVLRIPRLFAYKEPTAGLIPHRTGVDKADLAEAPWPQVALAEGFVLDGEPRFAEAQTRVWAIHDGTHLYIRAVMAESRMDTMVAAMTDRDAPLWEEEAIEIALTPADGLPHRFLVNPLGARYDSQGGHAAWNGDWTVHTEEREEGWIAYVVIPFETIGASHARNTTWALNFVRHRRNVRDERSAWATRDGHRGAPLGFGQAVVR